ncbi:MAG TPA: RNA methyltransferase [Acidimicrobiales bacterium]
MPASGSPPDDRLDDYRALNDPARRRAVERRGGYFVVEGLRAVEALLASPYPVRSILVVERREPAVRAALAAHGRAGVPVLVRPEAEVRAVVGFPFHRGVLAAADRLPLPPVADVVAGARRLAVVEGVNDHENLGALFRNAAAFGVDAVLADPTTADPLYRRSVRVSLGHVLRVPWTRLAAWPEGLGDLRAAGFVLVALTPAREAEPIDALAADPPDRLALLLGAEGPGLSTVALAAADRRVRIPIAPGVDSLNVATAAAITFHRLAPV